MCAHCAVEVNTENISSNNSSKNIKGRSRRTSYGQSNADGTSKAYLCESGSVTFTRSMFHTCCSAKCKVHQFCAHHCEHHSTQSSGTICYYCQSSSTFYWPSTLSTSFLIKCTILKSQLIFLLCLVPFLLLSSTCIISVSAHPSEYIRITSNRVALICNLI